MRSQYLLVGKFPDYGNYVGRETFQDTPMWKTFTKVFTASNDEEARVKARELCKAGEPQYGEADAKVTALYRISRRVPRKKR